MKVRDLDEMFEESINDNYCVLNELNISTEESGLPYKIMVGGSDRAPGHRTRIKILGLSGNLTCYSKEERNGEIKAHWLPDKATANKLMKRKEIKIYEQICIDGYYIMSQLGASSKKEDQELLKKEMVKIINNILEE